MKKIALLGSTGSIGRQTVEVVDHLGPEYKIVALAAGSSDQLLAGQVKKCRPDFAALYDCDAAKRLRFQLNDHSLRVAAGEEGLLEAATWPDADIVVLAQVGFSGFKPLVAALEAGKKVALANKESLVVGGDLLKRKNLLDRNNIFPVDSEHSAIWQCLTGGRQGEVEKICLTASGGPFFGYSKEMLEQVTPEQALAHPNWSMGPKITIDSATMMNKGLEVIEARWLFDLPMEKIDVLIHRESLVHSMVEYIDGSVLAQLGAPDMRLPIQHALTYPERLPGIGGRLDLKGRRLTFSEPDTEVFPCLTLAYRALQSGGTMPAVLNGANEIAVQGFLDGVISFNLIPQLIEKVMNEHKPVSRFTFEEAVEADSWARTRASEIMASLAGRMS